MTEITHVRLELAREPGHPSGDQATGYDLYVPLDQTGHIDAEAWRRNRGRCVVRKFAATGESTTGLVLHGPGGRWEFDYEDDAFSGDEWGVSFGAEPLVVGEYVSVRGPSETTHTYRVAAAIKL